MLGLIVLLLAFVPTASAESTPEKRTILALFQGGSERPARFSRAHVYATMPLHHLGLKVYYHDIRTSLPDLSTMPDLRGVLTWFSENVAEPELYSAWATRAMAEGIPFAILGDMGISGASDAARSKFLNGIGLSDNGRFRLLTHRLNPKISDPNMIGFERPFVPPYQGFAELTAMSDSNVKVHLSLGGPNNDEYVLVATGPGGGVAIGGSTHVLNEETGRGRWILNPFNFFERTFKTKSLPKPDATTLVGRRIYFSHVDGDGWRNGSDVAGYRDDPRGATTALLDKVFKAYPDLPVTIAPISADLDTAFFGTQRDHELAREIFALPHVEAASHTHTHPFAWNFFQSYSFSDEQKIIGRQPKLEEGGSRASQLFARMARRKPAASQIISEGGENEENFVPRAYTPGPFDLQYEISGSASAIGALTPTGRPVGFIQWSGNTVVFKQAIDLTRNAGMRNINGGDTRLDPEFASLLHVAPLASTAAGVVQPFAQMSNENTYTELWSRRFYGLSFLKETIRNTGRPIRLKPVNVYFHNYSGEKTPALAALLTVLDDVRIQELAPIRASRYAAIIDGFFSLKLDHLGADRWQVSSRDGLNTIRFDKAVFKAVDFHKSVGVIGQRHTHGSLYVALDPNVADAVIQLRSADRADIAPQSTATYLIHSRWNVAGVSRRGGGFSFRADGYGLGDFSWHVAPKTKYDIDFTDSAGNTSALAATADAEGTLSFTIDHPGIAGIQVDVRPREGGT